MKVWTPIETVWPVWALFVALCGALWFARHELTISRKERPWMLGLLVLAFGIRWWWLPVQERYFPDGHEADYYDRFTALVEPTQGGTVMYPSMQWLWYGLGHILPHEPWVPALMMAVVSCLGIGFCVMALQRWVHPEVGWIAGLLLALHPVHAAWSSSAYNVILPFSLGMLGMAAAGTYVSRRRPSQALMWVASLAFGLAVTTRIDSIVLLGPALWMILFHRPEDVSWSRTLKNRVMHLTGPLITVGLVGVALHPLLSREIPGQGERERSLAMNWQLTDVHMPFDGSGGLLLLALGAVMAGRRWPMATMAMVLGAVGNHLLMSSFNDYADRHALMSHLCVVGILAAGGASMVGYGRWIWATRWIPVAGGLCCLWGLMDMRERFYGTDDAFNRHLARDEWAELPRLSMEEATQRDGESCGWVVEGMPLDNAEAFSYQSGDPDSAEKLRSETGCLRWCADAGLAMVFSKCSRPRSSSHDDSMHPIV